MKWFRALISIVLLFGIFWVLNSNHGMVPPLGKFLNPFEGFWQNGENDYKKIEEIVVGGLKDSVRVVWDKRRVPHIFAQNNHDLFFAQGFITARDRLWQMEIQTFDAAGRLAEIIGESMLEHDRLRRRTGMVYTAEKAVKAFQKDSNTKTIIRAYSEGVNAFIHQIKQKDLPVEYKLMDYKPEHWTALKSALLLKLMAWNLTWYSPDLSMTHSKNQLDDEKMENIYPYYQPFMEPIIPKGTQWQFNPQLPPRPQNKMMSSADSGAYILAFPHGVGSNNWAVSGELTKSGYPILCSDPHLGLNLPSIWYEVQLVSPEMNVYGVSLPGAPSVIIGFNQNIAWGLTNSESDVTDWYSIKFRDFARNEYFYNWKWEPTQKRVEEIKVKDGKTVVDTVIYTHHGPVVYHKNEKPYYSLIPNGAAMRWTGHETANELLSFVTLNGAENYQDYWEALRHYGSPPQNFAYADAKGNIAIWHNGLFPIRWKGQGRFILDGSNPSHNWCRWIPDDHLPHIKNPDRGFVSSANQNPVDEKYPYYLGYNYAGFERGTRINECLSDMQKITPQDMIAMQSDVLNLRARKLLPRLLTLLQVGRLNKEQSMLYQKVKTWDFEHRADRIAPTFFNQWWRELSDMIWKDEVDRNTHDLKWPSEDVTIDLILNHPDSQYFDNLSSTERESLQDLVQQSFQSAYETLTKRLGKIDESWKWGNARGTDINHLGRIPGFGQTDLKTSGNYGIINATTKHNGPSWRMVVSLGPEVKAWGIYPGGQSGNPGSMYYDLMIEDWVQGKIYRLLYLKSPHDEHQEIIGKTTIRNSQ